ncbi:MAG: hypothetical protein E6Q97_30750 [Desulfurellales bacterium]|nr:MAG: hypothetical protein E6Q97_30750 [Desulfurellales bacterium]
MEETVERQRAISAPKIYRAIAEAKRRIGTVGKNGKVTEYGNYEYRRFDDILNAVSPLLDEYGIVVVPKVVDASERLDGKKHIVRVRVRYTWYAEDGSRIVAVTEGEAFDMGDKARTKAQTVAYRIVLAQVLNIAYDEMRDPESGPQHRNTPDNPEVLRRVIGRVSRCTDTETLNALLQYVALCASGQGPAGEVLSQAQVKELRKYFGDAGDRCRLPDKHMLQLFEEIDSIAREPFTERNLPKFEAEPIRFAELDLLLSQATRKADRDRAVMTAMQSRNLRHITVEEFGELFAKHFPAGVSGEENAVGAIVAQAVQSTTIDELASHTRSIDGMRLHGKIDEKVAEYILGMFAKKIRLMQEQRAKGATDANGG